MITKVGDLSAGDFARRLAGDGVRIVVGPFIPRFRSRIGALAAPLQLLYDAFPLADEAIADFHINLVPTRSPRRPTSPLVEFRLDDQLVFIPFPRDTALPLVEWGFNFCIFGNAHYYLIIHAAVVERDGQAVLLPGLPGAGKSTLCAALVHHGWRLMSDEFALVRPADGLLDAVPRPISLKNESIDIVRGFGPDVVLGPRSKNTFKGEVAHMRPPADSVARAGEPSRPAWIIFPAFTKGAETRLDPVSRARAHFELASNSFNYRFLGGDGFRLLVDVIEGCACHRLTYSRLDEALALFDDLARGASVAA